MGAECCGGSKTSTADAAAKTDFGPASERLPAHDESKSWEQIAAEKKSYYDHRVSMFEEIKAKYQAAVAEAKEKNEEITVTMPDGSTYGELRYADGRLVAWEACTAQPRDRSSRAARPAL